MNYQEKTIKNIEANLNILIVETFSTLDDLNNEICEHKKLLNHLEEKLNDNQKCLIELGNGIKGY